MHKALGLHFLTLHKPSTLHLIRSKSSPTSYTVMRTIFLTVLALAASSTSATIHPFRRWSSSNNHWVNIWTSAPASRLNTGLPGSPYNSSESGFLNGTTIRQTFHVTLGASTIRLAISNQFSIFPLSITSMTVALPQANSSGITTGQPTIKTDTLETVTFYGNTSFEAPPNALIFSDPVNFTIPSGTEISVSIYLADGQMGTNYTGHGDSQTTSWFTHSGDQTSSANFTGKSTIVSAQWLYVEAIQGWLDSSSSRSLICLGDSITDGYQSTIDGNDRWVDDLFRRLQNDSSTENTIAVLNKGQTAGTVLNDRSGYSAVARIESDIISQPGTAYALIFEGVNDIGTADNTTSAQYAIGTQLIQGYTQIIRKIHTFNIPVIGVTITPFINPSGPSDPIREQTRLRVNDWIRTSGEYDAVFDFSAAIDNKTVPSQMQGRYASDYLHPNQLGYQALADSIDLSVFSTLNGGVDQYD